MFKNFKRLFPALLIISFQLNRISGLSQGLYKVKGKRDKVFYGYSFLNITQSTVQGCMAKCLENCFCMSFQLCGGKKCQLCSMDKIQQPSALQTRKGCTYFVFQRAFPEFETKRCNGKSESLFAEINCCTTSNPCQNSGTCEPASPTDNTTRFRCSCRDGYTGKLCQHRLAKSCRGYLNGNGIPGKFQVLDDAMKPFEVFCDFNLNSSMAWTLISSFKLKNKDDFNKSFLLDYPNNENTPVWDSYRLSKSRMESIRNDSSKWRMTCQYNATDGVVYTDYVAFSINKTDILTYNGSGCREVEYIDIRGHNCTNCTVNTYQKMGKRFHIDTYHGNCTFKPDGAKPCNKSEGEDSFGNYWCRNPAHRCSANETSTTQTWFGGN